MMSGINALPTFSTVTTPNIRNQTNSAHASIRNVVHGRTDLVSPDRALESFAMKRNITGKRMVYLSIVIVLVAILGVGWKMTARSSYESAAYSVVESDGPFEIREYQDLMLVTTAMKSEGSDGSFGRLFRYISGGNDDDLKVAMTTPVFMKPEGQETAGQMGFVFPEKVSSKHIPNPTDATVQIQKRAGGRFAVIRFSGRMDQELKVENAEKLRQWIETKGLPGSDAVEFAGYDPPWTPNPFRRNEILIRLQ